MVKLPGFADCLTNANVENNLFSGWSKHLILQKKQTLHFVHSFYTRSFVGLQSKYSGSASNSCDSTKFSAYINGPAGIHVFVTDEVLSNIKDESLFTLEVQNNKVLMKIVYKNEI